jgi:hypothetical protein
MQWQTELNEYSEGDWYIPMRLVEYEKHSLLHTSDYTPCNIFMEYEYINVGQDLDNLSALGWTMFEFSKSSHQWAYIMTYLNAFDNKNKISLCIGCADEGELPTIEQEELKIKEIPPTAVKRIMLHEFGHALGLGHYLEDANIANNELSLMYPTMFAFDHTEPRIELVDLEVLRYIYNSDGFGGQQGFVHGHHIEIDEVIDNIIEHVTLSKIEN